MHNSDAKERVKPRPNHGSHWLQQVFEFAACLWCLGHSRHEMADDVQRKQMIEASRASAGGGRVQGNGTSLFPPSLAFNQLV